VTDPAPGRHRSGGRRLRLSRADRPLLLLALAAGLALVVVVTLLLRPSASVPGEARWSGPPGAWEQVFADEFDGDGLDRSVWQPDRGGDLPAQPFNWTIEGAWFDPSNVAVTDGMLTLTVEREPRTVGEGDYDYSTGMVQTLPGTPVDPPVYVEARMRVPSCDGCWPAFWLHPLDRWPPEIDIAEFLEAGSEPQPSFNYFDADGDRTGPEMYGDPDVDHRDTFHTYGVLWEADRVVPYVDGVPYEALAATENVTDLPMMVILNLSLRGGYDLEAGARMDVDWVRIWRPGTA
jgi:beta-glucanase (GH16 family)